MNRGAGEGELRFHELHHVAGCRLLGVRAQHIVQLTFRQVVSSVTDQPLAELQVSAHHLRRDRLLEPRVALLEGRLEDDPVDDIALEGDANAPNIADAPMDCLLCSPLLLLICHVFRSIQVFYDVWQEKWFGFVLCWVCNGDVLPQNRGQD